MPGDAPTPLNITDEEWIAAGQACCGRDAGELESTKPAEKPTTVDISAEPA
jgi:hypothetical protein